MKKGYRVKGRRVKCVYEVDRTDWAKYLAFQALFLALGYIGVKVFGG